MINRAQQREDARQNRKRLVDAAREVFREHGLTADMREIATRAGLAVGTIYRNYPSKEDLVLALLDDASFEFVASLAPAEATPLKALQQLLATSIETADRYGWLIDAYFGRQMSDRCRREMERKSLELDFHGRCRDLLTRAIEDGDVRSGIDVENVTALLAGIASPWVCQPLLEARTAGEIAESTLDTLLKGISR